MLWAAGQGEGAGRCFGCNRRGASCFCRKVIPDQPFQRNSIEDGAAVFAATGEDTAAVVFPAGNIQPGALLGGVSILAMGQGFAVVTSERSDYLRALYGNELY